MRLTRRYRFSASHRLHSHLLTDDRNREVYGKCNHPYGHGHDYVLDVSVTGPLDPATGRIVDLEVLDSMVAHEILGPFEHRNLNTEVDTFQRVVPTTENLAVEIQRRLNRAWAGVFASGPSLERIRVGETKRNYIELA